MLCDLIRKSCSLGLEIGELLLEIVEAIFEQLEGRFKKGAVSVFGGAISTAWRNAQHESY